MMFTVSFGSENRENRIREMSKQDQTVGVILAAVHFEWMMKRAILKLGTSPTAQLREELRRVSGIRRKDRADGYGQDGYYEIWKREVDARLKKRSALGTVLGRLTDIRDKAMKVRGHIVHGNGTSSAADAQEAIELFLGAGSKLRTFAKAHDEDLDTRLKSRLKARPNT